MAENLYRHLPFKNKMRENEYAHNDDNSEWDKHLCELSLVLHTKLSVSMSSLTSEFIEI